MDRRSFIEQLGLLSGAGAVTSLGGCLGGNGGDNSGSGGGTLTVVMGSVYPSGHVVNEMAKKWASTVTEKTGGRIEITIEESFGGEKEVMEQTRIGAIQGTMIGAMWVIQYDPKNYWVESPFVFESWEQQKRAYESDHLNDGRERLRKKGKQKLIGPPVYRGYRHTSGNKPFKTPADINGVNLRVPDLSPWVNIWKGIGAGPTTVAFNELYSSLQQGVVDAQENPAQTVLSASLHEVQSHYTLTEHLASTGWFTINTDTLSKMSEEDRKIVTDTLTKNITELSKDISKTESKSIDKLKKKGMKIVEPNHDAWLSAAEQPLKKQFEKTWEPSLQEVRSI